MSQLFLPIEPKEPRSLRRTHLYKVHRGDSLDTIARRHAMTKAELRAMNNLKESAALVSGQILQVFRKKRRSHSMPALPDPLEPDGSRAHNAPSKSSTSSGRASLSPETRDRGNNEDDGSGDDAWVVLPPVKSRSQSHRQPTHSDDEPEMPTLIGGTPSDILSRPEYTKTLVPKLEACLPVYHRGYDWKLLYSLAQHGCSLHSLLTKVRDQSPTLIVIETSRGDVFGGFSTVAWRSSASYYGIGESFVFSNQPKFEHFRWSRLNSMLMLSNDQSIAMGGGGHFAWYMNSDLSYGSSGPSDTFGNRCLTPEPEFDIISVEVWGFVMKR